MQLNNSNPSNQESQARIARLSPEIAVSKFDSSIENHFKAVDTISKLCGLTHTADNDEVEIQAFANSLTFLREWRYFNYPDQIVKFAYEAPVPNAKEREIVGEIVLPQFSAAAVPKKGKLDGSSMTSSDCSKDFVLHVGGSVWALDWCPRIDNDSDNHVKAEFLAVGAHPPDSSYHKIGAPLSGKGVIQIWCLVYATTAEDLPSQGNKRTKRKYQKKATAKDNESTITPKKPRGRPRKKPLNESLEESDPGSQCMEALAIEYPSLDTVEEDSPSNENKGQKLNNQKKRTAKANGSAKPQRPRGRPRKEPPHASSVKIDSDSQCVQVLAIEYPSSEMVEEDTPSQENERQNPNNQKKRTVKDNGLTKPQRPRGRVSKISSNESLEKTDSNNKCVQQVIEYPEDSSTLHPLDSDPGNANEDSGNEHVDPNLIVTGETPLSYQSDGRLKEKATALAYQSDGRLKEKATARDQVDRENDNIESVMSSRASAGSGSDPLLLTNDTSCINLSDSKASRYYIPDDISLPRMMLSLAHNGKVAWDVKWRPRDACVSGSRHRMGFLAVLLGNGALEVWEVPFPHTVKLLYPGCQKDGTDPRFMKLKPVFRCSMLKCGDRQSIPLVVEWSLSSSHDMILAGCHDGVVALWKFSPTSSPADSKPVLCFSADTVPIRTLAWAPIQSDSEGSNLIVTAGHKGFKFWDIRDPFRPLWDFPVLGIICSLDWLPDPRCIIGSVDESLWFVSLLKAANDVPVTGKPFACTPRQGFHEFHCSSFAIWSVQASRLTGMVAYCTEDGLTMCFQATTRWVEKDPSRNKPSHFLCGSLVEDESALVVVSPSTNTPFPMKKSHNEYGDTPRSKQGVSTKKNKEKRAKEQISKGQPSSELPLAICLGNDPERHIACEDSLMAEELMQAPKEKASSSNMPNADEQGNEEFQREGSHKGEMGKEVEVFPPKIVAMHKVRWNMNRGSGRWLCYGGAAGLLRCQEVDIIDS